MGAGYHIANQTVFQEVMKTHDLKCWPEFFEAIQSGVKKFYARINDRDFRVGDTLVFHEYQPPTHENMQGFHTGRVTEKTVTYILHGASNAIHGIPKGVCVMSI